MDLRVITEWISLRVQKITSLRPKKTLYQWPINYRIKVKCPGCAQADPDRINSNSRARNTQHRHWTLQVDRVDDILVVLSAWSR